jgi:hypothetical protein
MPEEVAWDIRRQAAILARRKRAREVKFTAESPCDWRPQDVINPEDGTPFTRDGAWNFLADRLEDSQQTVQWVELTHPPGKKACVLLVPLGEKVVYIKFQLGAGKVRARSFHYSTQEADTAT